MGGSIKTCSSCDSSSLNFSEPGSEGKCVIRLPRPTRKLHKQSAVASLPVQRLSEAFQILRTHSNHASTRAVNVGYEKERNRQSQRQNQEQDEPPPMRAIADQHIAKDRDGDHQTPCRSWDAVPPRSLRVPSGIQDVVHSFSHEDDDRGGLRRSGGLDSGPQLNLQGSGIL